MTALVLKLTLAPALVAVATLTARRLGHGVGGLVGGLPVVAAPVLVVYAVERGRPFAAEAAGATVSGIVSLIAFSWVYGVAARRAPWPVAVAAGWGAFGAGTLLFDLVRLPPGVAALVCLAAIAASAPSLRRAGAGAQRPAGGDLLAWRLLATVVLVVALTEAAGSLSPHVAGLLAPFPIITAVLAGFTHARGGGAAANALLGGLVPGLVSFVLFFVVLAALDATATAFAAASLAALGLHAILLRRHL